MHDIRYIRENRGAFDAALKRRGAEPVAGTVIGLGVYHAHRHDGALCGAAHAIAPLSIYQAVGRLK